MNERRGRTNVSSPRTAWRTARLCRASLIGASVCVRLSSPRDLSVEKKPKRRDGEASETKRAF